MGKLGSLLMCNACWWLVVRLQQMLRLIELEKSVVEGGGAVGVAALLQEGLLLDQPQHLLQKDKQPPTGVTHVQRCCKQDRDGCASQAPTAIATDDSLTRTILKEGCATTHGSIHTHLHASQTINAPSLVDVGCVANNKSPNSCAS